MQCHNVLVCFHTVLTALSWILQIQLLYSADTPVKKTVERKKLEKRNIKERIEELILTFQTFSNQQSYIVKSIRNTSCKSKYILIYSCTKKEGIFILEIIKTGQFILKHETSSFFFGFWFSDAWIWNKIWRILFSRYLNQTLLPQNIIANCKKSLIKSSDKQVTLV